MRISQEEVEHVGKLARLQLTEEEKNAFSDQLSKILTYMEELNTVDAQGVDQMVTVVNQSNVLRADEVRPSISQKTALGNAPAAIEGFFSVPKIISDR